MLDGRPTWTVRLIVFSLALGGLRDPRLFALAGAAAWAAVWLERPALGPAAAWLPWLGWAALSTAASAQPLAGLPALARWSVVLACASLAAAWKPKEREGWLRSFLLVAAALAVAALVTGGRHHFRNEMTGLMPPYYNYTAFALSAAAAAAAAWILHPRGARGTDAKAAAALFALAVICLFLARSRGAWLGLGAASSVWAVRRFGARAAAVIAVAAALFAGAFAGGFLPASIQEILLKRYRLHAEVRPGLWRAAAGIAADAPWLGTGPGSFGAGFRRRPVEFADGAARWGMNSDHAHSEPLQAAAETGWAGLALWLLGAGAALRALLKRSGEEPVREAAAAAAAAMTAQLAIDNMLHIPALAALWLCALALAAPPVAAKGRPWPALAILAGAALAAVSWMPRTFAASSPARAAAVFPSDPGPREDLAYAAMSAGRAGEAETHWAAAQSLAPFNAVYPWRRAQIAGALGLWDRAEGLAARAVELEPGFLSARRLRAEALARLGRAPEARVELAEALRRSAVPGPEPASGYETAIRSFSRPDFDRVSALATVGRRPDK
ncbi:MAG: O-antigen ligase family protein [Elusimicrobia bacterium]|nr:O-antigen ligase family protein [Elusimicrobiota bacterium]